MTAPAGPTSAASSSSSPTTNKLIGAAMAVIVALAGYFGYTKIINPDGGGTKPPADDTAIKADAALLDGRPVPANWPAGKVLGLVAVGATAGSARWEISPSDVDALSIRQSDERQIFVPMPASGRTVTFRLDVAKGSKLATTTILVRSGDSPGPGPPKPDPKPDDPRPDPPPIDPDPNKPVDAKLRKLAADYFGSHPAAYLSVSSKLAAADPNYNEITDTIIDSHKQGGTAIGLYVDELVKPLYDSQLKFKDKTEAKRVYDLIGNSLLAGLRDAAAGK